MPAKNATHILGTEYDWLASDANGSVAMFSTAGGGFAPAAFLRDTDAHQAAIDAVLALPPSTAARFSPSLSPDLENTWRSLAERGLYAYDSDYHGGPYRLVAAPERPAQLGELPELAIAVASSVRLVGIRFDEANSLSGDMLRQSDGT